jgi:hypothetical protein
MIGTKHSDAGYAEEAKLPRRDWILLPALGLATVCLLAGGVELGARRMMTSLPTIAEDCLVLNDLSGVRGIHNCVVWEKMPESELTEYRFNSSGYRNDIDLGPKSPDTYRIVVVGTSMAAGFRVPREKTFGALLPAELSRRTGRKVELYNEALAWRFPRSLARFFNEAIAAKPDMILWVLAPADIGDPWLMRADPSKSLNVRARVWYIIKDAFATRSFKESVALVFSRTRTATLLADLLFASPSQYVKSSLLQGSYKSEFLQADPNPDWQGRLKEFDSNAANIEGQASKAGIPLVAVFLPDRTQVAMISLMGDWPKGFDPYKLDNDLRTIIMSHGGTYVDILLDFRTIPNPQLGYYAIDGHPNAAGHAIITRFLSDKLVDGAVAGLGAIGPQRAGSEPRQ